MKESFGSPTTISPLLLRNLLTSLFIYADKSLQTLAQKYKLLQLLRYLLVSAFLRLLPSLFPSPDPSSETNYGYPLKSPNTDNFLSTNTGGGGNGGGGGGGGESGIGRALSQLLSIVNDIPVSSRKYEVVRSLAEKLIDENHQEGSAALREVNYKILSAAFSRTLSQLEAAVMDREHNHDGPSGDVAASEDFGNVNRVLRAVRYYGDVVLARLGKRVEPRWSGSSAEKLAAEVLWLAQKMVACGCAEEAVCNWASSTHLAWLSLSAEPRIQGSLVKVSGSVNAWRHRKAYTESWWRPNATRGYLFLDTHPTDDLLPWPPSSPPLRVSNDISKIVEESKHVAPIRVRMVHAILEVFREGDEGVRWYVMGDDDSLFFVDNWVDVLEKYDHTKYVYIGGHSEFFMSNIWFSFDQGFGGAGFALSYPLVAAMVKDLEGCLRRYPYLNSADLITQYCVDELGVPLSAERGIHQIDLHGDISGFLSSHPQSPMLSLHHFDQIEPIFPTMNRSQSANHLMKAAKTDQSRMLQQTICYQKQTNWSFSISWGYSAHIYEKVLPRSVLKRPLETFLPWLDLKHRPYYMFNTRWPPFADSCEAPHVFFFESIDSSIDSFEGHNQIVMTYVRSKPRGLPTCSLSGSRSADSISKVRVFSPATKLPKIGRSECCDVVEVGEKNITEIKIRACRDDEIIA